MPFRRTIAVFTLAMTLALAVSSPALAVQRLAQQLPQQFGPPSFAPSVTADYFDARGQSQFHESLTGTLSDSNFMPNAFVAESTSPSVSSGRPSGIPIGLQAEWLTDSDVGLATAGVSIKAPLLRGFGRYDQYRLTSCLA